MSRATIYSLPDGVFDDEVGSYWGGSATPERIASLLPLYAPTIKRGDVLNLEEIRERGIYVWDGKTLHPFRNKRVYPLAAQISIDEFPTVNYYQEADLYHDLVWLDTTGYECRPSKNGWTTLIGPKIYQVQGPCYDTGSNWVPFWVTTDGKNQTLGTITDN